MGFGFTPSPPKLSLTLLLGREDNNIIYISGTRTTSHLTVGNKPQHLLSPERQDGEKQLDLDTQNYMRKLSQTSQDRNLHKCNQDSMKSEVEWHTPVSGYAY